MPFWVEMSCLEEKENLVLETITIDVLSPANKKIAYERYSLISCLNERQKKKKRGHMVGMKLPKW